MGWNDTLSIALNTLVGRSPVLDAVILFFAVYLSDLVVAVCLIALYRAPWTRAVKIEALVVAAASGLIARVAVVEGIRALYPNPRPFVALPEISALFTESSYSFPSGHASFFFALAASVYCYDRRWGKGLFIAAFFIGLGRVIAGVHYPLDIVAGAVVGVVVAYLTQRMIAHWYAEEQNYSA